jgi:hypothetical protein
MIKKSLNDLCINPFNEFNYTWPILIAGDVNNGYNGMTVSWGGLGTLWGKPVGFVFVRKSRHTYNFIENSDSVTLSFLNEDYANAKKIFVIYRLHVSFKFKRCVLFIFSLRKMGLPVPQKSCKKCCVEVCIFEVSFFVKSEKYLFLRHSVKKGQS